MKKRATTRVQSKVTRVQPQPVDPRDPQKAQAWSSTAPWQLWNDEFFSTIDINGEYVYKSIYHFAREKFPSDTDLHKRDWLIRSIRERPSLLLPWQGDWQDDRRIHKTKTGKQISILKEKIESELDLLETGKLLADSYQPFMHRVMSLFNELEAVTGTRVIRDFDDKGKPVSAETNVRNLKAYTSSLNKLVDIKIKIDNQFMHALGFDRPNNFVAYFNGIRSGELQRGEPGANVVVDRVQNLLMDLAKNQVAKAKMYELELPEDIEVVAKEIHDGETTSEEK